MSGGGRKKRTGVDAPEEVVLPHVRAGDYREVYADGALYRVTGQHIVATFYVEEVAIVGERMRLVEKRDDYADYAAAGVEETQRRLDVVAIRMPLGAIRALARAVSPEAQRDGETISKRKAKGGRDDD